MLGEISPAVAQRREFLLRLEVAQLQTIPIAEHGVCGFLNHVEATGEALQGNPISPRKPLRQVQLALLHLWAEHLER
ncbi:MAG: Uncharacterised protein [Prochlorococcus marinus str. MIT 9313]|nr:MAG: Uncharacterised protein [Prochlorococcus marinus str. MIT 9313]